MQFLILGQLNPGRSLFVSGKSDQVVSCLKLDWDSIDRTTINDLVAAGSISIDGGGAQQFTGITSQSNSGAGDSGSVTVSSAGQVLITGGGRISTNTATSGTGCPVSVNAGSLRREWTPPALMRITDHVNLQGAAPLLTGEGGTATVYDPRLGLALQQAAEEADVELRAGVYAALPGPAYETPAEIRMLARLGADAVGMSTAAEATAARSAGLRVAGISCLTNHAAGIADQDLTHAEVLASADRASLPFVRLLTRAVPRIAAELVG